jgi:hypothetical protein
VIIDEAHSSRSGETATELKGVLGGAELRKKAQEMAEEEGEVELERLFRSMAKRGQAAEHELLRLHRHAQTQDAGDLRPGRDT